MPPVSEKQHRWMFANRKKLEARGFDVEEWAHARKGKKLPEKVKDGKVMIPHKKHPIKDSQEKQAAMLNRVLTKPAGLPLKKTAEAACTEDAKHEKKESPAHEKAEHKGMNFGDKKLVKKFTPAQVEELAEEAKLPKKVSLKQFKAGLKVEREHKDVVKGNEKTLARIAVAHLRERSDYYSKLKKVEGEKKASITNTLRAVNTVDTAHRMIKKSVKGEEKK